MKECRQMKEGMKAWRNEGTNEGKGTKEDEETKEGRKYLDSNKAMCLHGYTKGGEGRKEGRKGTGGEGKGGEGKQSNGKGRKDRERNGS